MSQLKRILIAVAIGVLFVFLGLTFWVRDRYVVPILTYHHIGALSSKSMDLNTVSAASFERQIRWISRWGYHIISFADLVEGINKGHAFARNTVVIQFDDGYKDNYTYAYPVLKKFKAPATVFLVSDLIGTPGYLTWDEVKEMDQNGFIAGAHTRHHKYLPGLSDEEERDEIVGSKKVIEEHLGHPIDFFCYPSGGFRAQSKEICKLAGFKAAVTTNRGKDRFNQDLYELKRIRIKDSDNAVILWFKLSGYYNLLRKSKEGN